MFCNLLFSSFIFVFLSCLKKENSIKPPVKPLYFQLKNIHAVISVVEPLTENK